MPGELWRQRIQYGKETTYGTAVPATRIAYLQSIGLTAPPDIRERAYDVGRRDNVLSVGRGPDAVAGPVALAMNADELVEWALVTFAGGITPTTPVGATLARLWTFGTGTTLNSMTLERNDGARVGRWTGIQGNEFTVEGNAAQGNTVTIAAMGAAVDDTFSTLTGALTDRVPDDMEGWQTRFFIDALGATPGTTEITDLLVSWRIRMSNNMQHKKMADGTRNFNKINIGRLSLSAELRFEAAAAAAATELTNANAGTTRLLRLEFQNPNANSIETGYRHFCRLDIPGIWGAIDRSQEGAGSREYGFPLSYIYDPTNAFGVRLQLQNSRTSAF